MKIDRRSMGGTAMSSSNLSQPDAQFSHGNSVDLSPLGLLGRAQRLYVVQIDKLLRPLGLDDSRWRVLRLLDADGPISVSALADRTATRLPTMTRLIQRMESEGLVITRTSEKDGRVTNVLLSSKGLTMKIRARSVETSLTASALQGLDDMSIRSLLDALDRLTANLRD